MVLRITERVISAVVGLLLTQQALAFSLEPTVSVISLPGDTGGKTILLHNDRKASLPVSFEIFERAVNEDGSEVFSAAENKFVIFPPQAVVKPGATQAVRIQWLGGELAKSRSFTLYARELPIELSTEESGVKTLFRIGATVHVTASNFKAAPVLFAHRQEGDGVTVSISNRGSEFVYIHDLQLKFDQQAIGYFDLANIAGRTLITPGATRTFKVPDVQGAPILASQ